MIKIFSIIQFARANYNRDIGLALRKFCKKANMYQIEDDDIVDKDIFMDKIDVLFGDYLVFEYKLKDGQSFIEKYVAENPDELSEKDLKRFKDAAETQFYSEFEIMGMRRGSWILIEDVMHGGKYKVYDRLGSSNMPDCGTIRARLGKIGNKWEFTSLDITYYPITRTERAKKMLAQAVRSDKKYKGVSVIGTVVLMISMHDKKQLSAQHRKRPTKAQIAETRKELKVTFDKNHEKWGIKYSWEGLLDVIYNEDTTNALDMLTDTITKPAKSKIGAQRQLDFFMNCWNYFPHKCIDDKSPVEMR
jgi:hypothetical protein